MDRIFLHELIVDTIIGVHEWERQRPQSVVFDIEVGLPGRKAAHTDRLADTIDYEAVDRRIREDLARLHFTLLEALAEHVSKVILEEFGALYVNISLAKMSILPKVNRVGVMIERRREEL